MIGFQRHFQRYYQGIHQSELMSNEDREEPNIFKIEPLVIHPMEPLPPGRYRQSRFQRVTDVLTNWIFFGLIIGGGLYYSVHLILNYRHIHRDIREKAAIV